MTKEIVERIKCDLCGDVDTDEFTPIYLEGYFDSGGEPNIEAERHLCSDCWNKYLYSEIELSINIVTKTDYRFEDKILNLLTDSKNIPKKDMLKIKKIIDSYNINEEEEENGKESN